MNLQIIKAKKTTVRCLNWSLSRSCIVPFKKYLPYTFNMYKIQGGTYSSISKSYYKYQNILNNLLFRFPCDICDKEYANKNGLYRHRKTNHGILDVDTSVTTSFLEKVLVKSRCYALGAQKCKNWYLQVAQ